MLDSNQAAPSPQLDDTDRRILNELQEELPLVHRPFRKVAHALGLAEKDVVLRVKRMREQGYIRRLGPIIDNDILGRPTTLAVARVPAERLDAVGEVVSAHPRVTHNYVRRAKGHEIPYNLWFTFSAENEEDPQAGLNAMADAVGVPIRSLRATRKFKVGVRFPVLRGIDGEEASGA